jgi:hypothetical protein
MLPVRTFADGEGVVLTPSDINQVLLRVSYVRESRPPDRMMPSADGDGGAGIVENLDVDGEIDTVNNLRVWFAALFERVTADDDAAAPERIFVTGNKCSRFYAAVVGA